jgi:hypothetical protein
MLFVIDYIIRTIKSGRIRWVELVTRIGTLPVYKFSRKNQKKEVGYKWEYWVHVTYDSSQLIALVNTVMEYWVP